MQVVEQMLLHNVIILATPVYWYSMSGYMKVFFDRLTDVVSSQKQLGRQLKGKRVGLLAISNSDALPEGFEIPFSNTAKYLGMNYLGCFFSSSKELKDNLPVIEKKASQWVVRLKNNY